MNVKDDYVCGSSEGVVISRKRGIISIYIGASMEELLIFMVIFQKVLEVGLLVMGDKTGSI